MTASNSSVKTLNPKLRNILVALAAIVLSGLITFALKSPTSSNALANMAKTATPYEQAMTNGKPSLVEFYANWCGACKSMAPTLQTLKKQYGDRVNFVMLNVDNDKWLPEVTKYKVEGIPHFLYLNPAGELQGTAIGEQPQSVLDDNLQALINKTVLPHAQVLPGQTSDYQPPTATKPSNDDPRSHGAQVKAAA